MQPGVILYQSKYGATKKYAMWLQQKLGFDCYETKKATIQQIMPYRTILLGGGIYASHIAGLSFLKKNIHVLQNKTIAIFCVGASPYDETVFREIQKLNLKGDLKSLPCFYCRGAWDEKKMTVPDKLLCKMLLKAVAGKDPTTLEPWQSALMSAVGQARDWTDQQNVEPILQFLGEQTVHL